MPDPRLEKFAQVLVDYSLEIKAGDLMRIRGSSVVEPLAREVFRAAVRKGAHPFLNLQPADLSEIFFREAPDESLDYISPIAMFAADAIDADLVILGDYNSYSLAGVPPERIARQHKSSMPLMTKWRDRSSSPGFMWCATLFPSLSSAQDARMSLRDYEDFVYHAARLDTPDPVAAWQEASAIQADYCRYLTDKREIHIQADGTDLKLAVQGRTWINADGQKNFPDGEVFTGPIENSANGHIRYTFPTIHNGRGAEDVRLWFEDGQVVKWEAREGKELLDELFAMDDGARRIGELAIGTNYNVPTFTKNILFDEKIGGTCHLAVGFSIPGTGGMNESALHWDMICDLRDGGSISADGEMFHENGQWKI